MKKVEVKISIEADPETVILAFTEPAMLKGWWHVEKTLIEKKVKGLYVLVWGINKKGMGYVSSGTIKEYIKDSKLVIENFVYLNPEKLFLGPMTLAIEALKKKNYTEVYLCQDGYQDGADWDWYYEAVKVAWPKVMQTLKSFLEQQKNNENPTPYNYNIS